MTSLGKVPMTGGAFINLILSSDVPKPVEKIVHKILIDSPTYLKNNNRIIVYFKKLAADTYSKHKYQVNIT